MSGNCWRPTALGMVCLGCGLADESTRHGPSQGAACGSQKGPTGEVRGYQLTRDMHHRCISFTKGQKHPRSAPVPVGESTKYPSKYAW